MVLHIRSATLGNAVGVRPIARDHTRRFTPRHYVGFALERRKRKLRRRKPRFVEEETPPEVVEAQQAPEVVGSEDAPGAAKKKRRRGSRGGRGRKKPGTTTEVAADAVAALGGQPEAPSQGKSERKPGERKAVERPRSASRSVRRVAEPPPGERRCLRRSASC